MKNQREREFSFLLKTSLEKQVVELSVIIIALEEKQVILKKEDLLYVYENCLRRRMFRLLIPDLKIFLSQVVGRQSAYSIYS